jgi:alpha(1,3/1,4) fucosyltransferase
MEKLRVNFVDMWPEFDKDENIFLPILKKYFDVEITSINCELVIHSIYNGFKETPKYKCKKILFLGENYRPSQFSSNYSISFDTKSDTNYYLPLWQFYLILQPELKDKLFNRVNYDSFDRFCSFTVSNGNNFFRNGFFDQLNGYKKVHSYGRFKTNDFALQKLSQGKYWRIAKNEFFNSVKHKFCISFENNSYPGYTTEKIMDAFLGGSMPIYWGNPRISQDWNTKAFVNAIKGGTMDLIKKIDTDNLLFNEIYNEPVFTEEQKQRHTENIMGFEPWLINCILK